MSTVARAMPSAFRLMVTALVSAALAGAVHVSGAVFTGLSTNPSNSVATMTIQAPSSLSASSGSGGVVNLSWSASTTSAGSGHSLSYVVLRGPAGGPYAQIGSTGASVLSYSDTPFSDGAYDYVVQTNVSGTGSFQSANTSAATAISDRTAPTAATSLTSSQGAKAGVVTVNLAWTAATDALAGVQGYEVRWSNVITTSSCPAADPASYPGTGTVGAVTSATLPLSGTLQSGKKYCAYLVTIDGVGNRSVASATTGPTTAR